MHVEEFDEFAHLPENADMLLEFIGGEIFEVCPSPFYSSLASWIGGFISAFVDDKNMGHVTGEGAGYCVSGERYIPRVAFISKARQSKLPNEGYNPISPDLAVEVIPASFPLHRLRIKLANYLAAGTTVWVFFPKQVQVYAPGMPVKTLNIDDTLDGGDILPGFTLPLRKIFID